MTGLRERIEAALAARRYSPDEFETVTNLLLEPIYPGLVPIPGGSDEGRDADLPRGGSAPFRLITTTESGVIANVRKSLRRLTTRGLAVPAIVVATNQVANADLRRRIEQLALDHGTQLINVHDRHALVPLLYRQPELRIRLLNISGASEGVVDRPLELDVDVAGRVDLVGRAAELAAVASAPGDVLLVGGPGSGKTRVASESTSMFLEGHLTDEARDAIRRDFPERVVVDDAVLRLGEIDALRALRLAERLPFKIVAIAWSEDEQAVAEHLPSATVIALPDMERPQINEVIKSLGVTGHILTSVILEAARGRPGWAASLAALASNGGVRSVVTGEALLARVKPYVRSLAATEERGLAILAAIAAIGGAQSSDVDRLGSQLSMARPDVRRIVDRASRSGLLESRWGRIRVSPSLLAESLVAAWFFSSADRADFLELIDGWPDRRRDLLLSALRAARLGSETAATFVRERLDEMVAHGLLVELSSTTRENAEQAVVLARAAGGDVDVYKRGLGARSAVAIHGLLDLAVGDVRDPHRTPDHPARILGEYARALHPDLPHRVEVRDWIVDEAMAWFRAEPGRGRALAVGQVLEGALDPWLEGHWLEPVSGTSVELVGGLESAETMEQIRKSLWPRVAEALPGFSDPALIQVIELVGTWARTAAGIPWLHGLRPSATQASEARLVAEQMAHDLEPLCVPSLSLTLALRRVMDRWHWPGLAAIDEQLALIVAAPGRDRADRERQLSELGERWDEESPDAVLGRLAEWRAAAAAAGIETGWALLVAFTGLAQATERPTDWARAAIGAGFAYEAASVLQASAEKDANGALEWLYSTLDGPARAYSMQVALNPRSDPTVQASAAQTLEDRDAGLVEHVMMVRDRADMVASTLLHHGSLAVAQRAALSFDVAGNGHGPTLPPEWQSRWDEVFLTIRPAELDGMAEYELESVVERLAASRPDLIVAWVSTQIDGLESEAWSLDLFPFSATTTLRPLPGHAKAELVRRTAGRPFADELLGLLLTPDVSWVEPLLEGGDLDPGVLLRGIGRVGHEWAERQEVFEAFASVLVRMGVEPAALVELPGVDGWLGSEAEHLRIRAEYFAVLATSDDPDLARLGQAGEAYLRPRIGVAEASERERRVRGRD